ncbi:MAG: hypothetical protein MPEBLZ_02122 [Candidatus Methanoperedens nitroreducens]|uniref:Uncharacterized protein n=1 Tax=Candidatus Methanoperedens nitratireducens TaxID=1392998 RepID=A0A0N8KQX0_9EURY|nr:hypothetical protein [Candidatus Methanoperedens sp. BLZ2]KAB2944877.1 MAG: hypothetical protein F9K14_12615 [Candidatus Methanoperedens sp.]KPQ43314.1 MAG: hypothetical protein MPEBLZ_02122 [Candidatus Methanoperedens sp. BLZ1]MBZ0173751.1 hypothetical protein [Candidatus Methanoperedens nitroreducens]MCX9078252.1 hypothetical protein [Candidatus Methanoperedens sp.]MCX9087780.1 hypothetical protein [Candidatus Methanoperedens sp.]
MKIEKRNPLALDAIAEGRVIKDNGFWDMAIKKFNETKTKYELIKNKKHWISLRMQKSLLEKRKETSL